MPYLNVDVAYFDHPKTRRLVAELGSGSELLPLRLWKHCALVHPEDGKLLGYSEQEIENLIGWSEKKGAAVASMVKNLFLEKIEGGYKVHAWKEHQGHIVAFKKRSKRANSARWSKTKPRRKKTSDEKNDDPTRSPCAHVKESLIDAQGVLDECARSPPTKPTIPTKPTKELRGEIREREEPPENPISNSPSEKTEVEDSSEKPPKPQSGKITGPFLAVAWKFYLRRAVNSHDLEVHRNFDELLRQGISGEKLQAEIADPSRFRGETIWALEKRMLPQKTKTGETLKKTFSQLLDEKMAPRKEEVLT